MIPRPARRRLQIAIIAPLGVLVCAAAASAASVFPPRRAGFWETTMTMAMTLKGKPVDSDKAPWVSAMCADPATDAIALDKMVGNGGNCLKFDITKSGDTYTIAGSCPDPMGGGKGVMTTHGTMIYHGDTAIHIASDSVSPSMTSHIDGDAKWIGACPAGMKPGDFGTMPGGVFKKQGNMLEGK
ncbi:MAG: DUF3617 family protein [Rhodospirillales bacterium]|nr:DUF3617 family protein [Rhodospirillales bacterium]MDE2200414.1 DUF3617 family protein [Rhodospirillales bacterium]MDE2575872.1 DUF3617 family protein [Rhodospirillales bacterium]